MRSRAIWDCLIVGAGPAGLGVAAALQQLGLTRYKILDRHEVGGSFLRWPKEMRLITPSFPSNSIGMLDLNSVAIGTSPGFSLRTEHPTGFQYAAYLQALAEHFEFPVQPGVDVEQVTADGELFRVQTSAGEMRSRSLVWAAGEFQYPRVRPFPGSEHCVHNSQVRSWGKLSGRDRIVIGGYESGLDAAVHLTAAGKRVRVVDRNAIWDSEQSDPSVVLSPFTHERLRDARQSRRLNLLGEFAVARVEKGTWQYRVIDSRERVLKTGSPPILATGFEGSLRLVQELFELRDDGFPLLNSEDESTIAPGLFLAGPAVRHEQHVFCFIYKFRQRFAVVARAIGQRLGIETESLETYRQWGMFLDDLSCCGQECVC
jgi:putative flavoprotein involved in K+ transport